jgi:hypothetical protein
MPLVSPYRTTPQLGPDLTQVAKAGNVWYDGAKNIGSPQTGDVEYGDDGREYIWVQATAAIPIVAAPGTQLALTVNSTYPRVTAAAGTGGYYAPNTGSFTGTLAAGDNFWAAKGTAP